MLGQTDDAFDTYTAVSDLGTHEVSLPHATAEGNERFYRLIQSDPRWLYRDLWAYIHGYQDTCPLDSWDAVLTDCTALTAIVRASGVIHVIDVDPDQDRLTPDQQSLLQCGGEPVLVHRDEVARVIDE